MKIKTYNSKVGKLYIAIENNAVLAISFFQFKDDYLKKLKNASSIEINGNNIDSLMDQLSKYFSGKNIKFSVKMALHGTDFQKKVWLACAEIPYGESRSYGDLAKTIKKPKAFRAVGTALGANPISIIIPCHRVLRTNGDLGGYAGGLDIKKQLLDIENSALGAEIF